MLSNKQIKEFQRLYRERFGKEISHKDAMEKGIKLINLVKLIYKPKIQKK